MKKNVKLYFLFGIMLLALNAVLGMVTNDGYSNIAVKEGNVNGTPRGNTIEASINGHTLSIVFTQNVGHVTVDVETDTGTPVDSQSLATPDSTQFYIAATGNYVFTITLSNGDEYYGEFSVTD